MTSTPLRSAIRDLVQSIEAWDELETAHRDDALAWIESGAELFRQQKPATPPKHLVAYFAVLDPQRQRLLLVDHRQAGLWLPSGGHVEPGEHPRATVMREAKEELGLDAVLLFESPVFVTVTETVGTTAGHFDVSLWYAVCGDSSADLRHDEAEFERVAWFPLAELPGARVEPHLHRFGGKLAELLARRRGREGAQCR